MRTPKLFVLALGMLWSSLALAAAEPEPMFRMKADLGDMGSLQRGAHTFMNYCASCHSASFVRYGRIAEDLQLPEKVVKENLMFTTDKIGDTINVAMRPADSAGWFGVTPPDLSVIARVRGSDWLYSFLLSYYLDPKTTTGWNNLMFPNTAMPHPLWELQGTQSLLEAEAGEGGHQAPGLEAVEAGSLSAEEYQGLARDLVNFLVYMGEPAALHRHRIGFWVIAFLLVFAFLAYQLKKEYWKDVH